MRRRGLDKLMMVPIVWVCLTASILFFRLPNQVLGKKKTNINSFAGPAAFIFKEFSECPPSKSGHNLVITKGIISHKYAANEPVFNGAFYLLTPLEDSLTALQKSFFSTETDIRKPLTYAYTVYRSIHLSKPLAVSSFSSWNSVSGWTPNAFRIELKNFCTMLFQSCREIIVSLLRYCDEKPPLTCPLLKHNYTIIDMPTAFKLKSFPIFHYNKWKIHVQFFRKTEIIACIHALVDSVPLETVRQTVVEV